MNIIIVSNYFYPEIGAAPNRITNLAEAFSENRHNTYVVCPLPNYPRGRIFKNYKGKFFKKEKKGIIDVFRYWIYPSVSGNPLLRILSMFSFAITLWFFGFKLKTIRKADWVIVQNSPLLVSMSAIILLKKIYRKKIALNISDLWPLSALELGAIKKGKFYSLLEWIEKFNYRNSDLILGQSEEILSHVDNYINKPNFLYRNLQISNKKNNEVFELKKDYRIRIIYAGLLGVAQGVLDIIQAIDFASINAELHIYGHGNEEKNIVRFIANNPDRGVQYKGSVSKEELHNIMHEYHASIVPLKNRIHGAVPSKIFELIHMQVPVLFCGGGEGAKIVEEYETGFSSAPGNFEELKKNIIKLRDLNEADYNDIKHNCLKADNSVFDFNKQLDKLTETLANEK